MNRRSLLSGVMLILAMAGTAKAQDAGLYDAPPPPDSAFVRIIRASGSDSSAQIGPVSVELATAISPYAIVKGGALELALGAAKHVVTLEKARFYTVALGGEMQPIVFEDAPIDNPAKSAVYLYNLGQTDAALFAPKQNVDVVAAIPSGKSGHRMINAVTLDLDVVADGKATAIKAVVLERRTGTSIVVLPDGTVGIAQNSMVR
jgi:Alginate O-acetyl transferase AlgF